MVVQINKEATVSSIGPGNFNYFLQETPCTPILGFLLIVNTNKNVMLTINEEKN